MAYWIESVCLLRFSSFVVLASVHTCRLQIDWVSGTALGAERLVAFGIRWVLKFTRLKSERQKCSGSERFFWRGRFLENHEDFLKKTLTKCGNPIQNRNRDSSVRRKLVTADDPSPFGGSNHPKPLSIFFVYVRLFWRLLEEGLHAKVLVTNVFQCFANTTVTSVNYCQLLLHAFPIFPGLITHIQPNCTTVQLLLSIFSRRSNFRDSLQLSIFMRIQSLPRLSCAQEPGFLLLIIEFDIRINWIQSWIQGKKQFVQIYKAVCNIFRSKFDPIWK